MPPAASCSQRAASRKPASPSPRRSRGRHPEGLIGSSSSDSEGLTTRSRTRSAQRPAERDLVGAAEDLADAAVFEHGAQATRDQRRDREHLQLVEHALLGDGSMSVTTTCSSSASFQGLARLAAEDAVGGADVDRPVPISARMHALGDGGRGIDDVVDDHVRRPSTSPTTAISSICALRDDCAAERKARSACRYSRSFSEVLTAGVDCDHHQVFAVQPQRILEVVRHDRQGGEVVDRLVEVALNLPEVQVD